jgi:hypothetical protein
VFPSIRIVICDRCLGGIGTHVVPQLLACCERHNLSVRDGWSKLHTKVGIFGHGRPGNITLRRNSSSRNSILARLRFKNAHQYQTLGLGRPKLRTSHLGYFDYKDVPVATAILAATYYSARYMRDGQATTSLLSWLALLFFGVQKLAAIPLAMPACIAIAYAALRKPSADKIAVPTVQA